MAQIIKHRRGSITQLKDVTARIGELVVATGSISDLNGPMVFVGETEGVAGAYRPLSKIYQGSTAPTISVGSHGSVIDGTPFYATGNKTLYILNKDGNTDIDLTGNIEGNTISGVTINNLTGSTAYIANVSGSFTGSGIGLYDIPASGITGLELNRISDGSATASISQANGLRVNTNTEITGALIVTGNITGSNLYLSGNANIDGNITLGGNITIGDATTDIINFGGEVSSSIVPDVHNAFDLGSSTKNWRNLHVSGTAYVDTLEARQVNFTDLGVLEDLIVSGSTFLGNGGDITVVSGSLYNDQLTEKRLVVVGVDGLLTDYSGLTFDNSNLNLSGALEVTNIQGTGSLYLKGDKNDSRYFEIYNTAAIDTHIKSNGGLSFFGDDTNYLKIDDSLQTATIVGVNGVIVSSSLQVTGSIYNDQLTDNRVVIVGTNGLIEDDANFTFDGTVLNIGQGNLEADVADGDIRTSGSLLVKNSAIVTGSLGVHGHIDLSNEAQIRITDDTANTVYGFYDGSNILGAYYQMFGSDYANAAQRGGAEFVFDSTNSGQGGFNIAEYNGSTWLRKLFVDASGLAVTGTTTLNGNLIVTGTTEAKGAVGINSTLDVTGSAQFKGTINVDGESTLASATVEDLTQDRIVTVGAGGSLIDSSGFTYNGTVFKIGDGQFEVDTNDGDIRTSGSLTVEGGQTVNGDVTVNGVLTVTGNTQLQSNLYISGNLEVLGSATNVTIQSTTIELDDNIIRLNAYSPFERYAGFEVIDSGSTGVSASLVWDGQNDYWMFVSSSGQSSKMIGTTAGTYGTETSLTNTYFPIATGPNTIGDSLLRYSGTTLSFNTNKFTIDSGTGDTLVSGNFTLSYSGGTDNGNNTSAIMFRNSSNVVGFVTTTETTDVLDGILGYKNSDGALVFSTVIDGGGY
jgi:cytoskeletal protein CcmA (bactofilin family)